MGNTHRHCAVRINNNTKDYIMCSHRMFIHSGHCEVPLTSTIGPSADGFGLFIKKSGAARGAVGIFTYDLYNECTQRVEKTIAVMFNNPFDFTRYVNQVAVGIFDRNQPCDYNLFDKMCHHTGSDFVRDTAGSKLTYRGDDVTISASMTDAHQPDLDVYISNSDV